MVLRLAFYTDATDYGGAEQSLGNLLAYLDPRHEATVIGVSRDVVERVALRRSGTSTVMLPPIAHKWDVIPIAAHIRALRRLRPDICHINLRTPYSCQFGIVAVILARGSKLVAVEHLPMRTSSVLRRRGRRLLAPHFDAHLSVGLRAARLIEDELGLRPGSIGTIYNGVPDLALEPIRRATTTPTIGSVGRLSWQKGYDLLIEALARLPGVNAVIVGEGPQRDSLESLARVAKVDERMELVGWRDDARRYLAAWDVFVLPSRFEGFPLVILEAMLSRVAVVATDVGSISESVIDGETGILVPANDPDALAEACSKLLGDPELRRRMGERGRELALSRFGCEAMAAAFERVYEEITA